MSSEYKTYCSIGKGEAELFPTELRRGVGEREYQTTQAEKRDYTFGIGIIKINLLRSVSKPLESL
jgi:hypothetical protein